MMSFRIIVGITLSLIISLNKTMAIETPKYKLIFQDNGFEVREYQSMIIASTKVDSDYRNATSTGFRRIANYIFGGNDKEMSISMTAPVISKKSIESPSLYEISFVMPKKYSLEDLPKPSYSSVRLEKTNLGKVICIKFGGWATEKNVKRYQNDLIKSINERGLESNGDFLVAQYNSPWAIPPFRKNEILIKIK